MATGAKPKKPKTIKDSKDKRTSKDVKIATSNLFILNSDIPVYGNIEKLVLQELNSGQIIDYADNSQFLGNGVVSTFTGNAISAGILESASNIQSVNNPTPILANPNSTADYLNLFQYKLNFYLPNQGTGENGESVYMDSSNNLIINTVNVQGFQEVEVEFWNYETEINDTIIE